MDTITVKLPPPLGAKLDALVRRRKQSKSVLVREAIERLPDDYRDVIVLRNLQRLPFDEVARRLNRSRPAAQMLWARAIQKLRELLPDASLWQVEG